MALRWIICILLYFGKSYILLQFMKFKKKTRHLFRILVLLLPDRIRIRIRIRM